MDKLYAMRAFVTIVDRGSLTAAAEALGKSLPTVVRTLATLEQSLDVSLLTRTTRRIALTEEGRRYLQHCRRILLEVEEAELELNEQRNESAGQLVVTAPVLFGQSHVAPGVSSFLQQFPQASVELLLHDRVVDLVDEGIDLAVRIAHLEDSSLIARRVGQVRRVLCASPEFIASQGCPEEPADLANFECLRWRTLEGGNLWRFQQGERVITIHPGGRFTSNHIAAALKACVAGLGIASFLSYQVEALVSDGKLRVLLPQFQTPPVPISLVHTYTRSVPNRVRTLMTWLAQDLRKQLATHQLV